MAVVVGQVYIYDHPQGLGFGEQVKVEAGFGELSAEMTELDLKDGQLVQVDDIDADSGWPVINWTDAVGIDRRTTIEPALFDTYFKLQP